MWCVGLAKCVKLHTCAMIELSHYAFGRARFLWSVHARGWESGLYLCLKVSWFYVQIAQAIIHILSLMPVNWSKVHTTQCMYNAHRLHNKVCCGTWSTHAQVHLAYARFPNRVIGSHNNYCCATELVDHEFIILFIAPCNIFVLALHCVMQIHHVVCAWLCVVLCQQLGQSCDLGLYFGRLFSPQTQGTVRFSGKKLKRWPLRLLLVALIAIIAIVI